MLLFPTTAATMAVLANLNFVNRTILEFLRSGKKEEAQKKVEWFVKSYKLEEIDDCDAIRVTNYSCKTNCWDYKFDEDVKKVLSPHIQKLPQKPVQNPPSKQSTADNKVLCEAARILQNRKGTNAEGSADKKTVDEIETKVPTIYKTRTEELSTRKQSIVEDSKGSPKQKCSRSSEQCLIESEVSAERTYPKSEPRTESPNGQQSSEQLLKVAAALLNEQIESLGQKKREVPKVPLKSQQRVLGKLEQTSNVAPTNSAQKVQIEDENDSECAESVEELVLHLDEFKALIGNKRKTQDIYELRMELLDTVWQLQLDVIKIRNLTDKKK